MLTALSKFDDDNRAYLEYSDYLSFLNYFLDRLDVVYANKTINIPVFGSGITSPIQDEYIEKYLAEKELNLVSTLDGASAYMNAELVIIAAPTNYDSQKNFFDTHYVEDVIELVIKSNPNTVMVIKSTIPVGYTESIRKKYNTENIIFSP